MTQVRDNIFSVTYSELGQPAEKGYYPVPGAKEQLLLDEADLRYIREYLERGYEPTFFISRTVGLRDAFIVVARQRV